jgi:hypothetical protein
MQLNEPVGDHEHATASMKVLLLIFALVLIGTLAYLVKVTYSLPDGTENAGVSVIKKQAQADQTAVNCGDEAYAFSLKFSDKWDGYKIKEVSTDEALVTCYVTVPTTAEEEPWTEAATDRDAGYASVLAISVYTPTQWEAAKAGANPPTQLETTDDYVWAWAPSQALPQDLQDSGIADEAAALVATFKAA